MDIKTLIITFGMIFLAELGDKTQIATLVFSAKSNSPLSVFIGASLALICTSFIAAFLGAGVHAIVPLKYIKIIGGIIFLIIGTIYLAQSF